MKEEFLSLNDYDFASSEGEKFSDRGPRVFRHATLTGLFLHLLSISFINRNLTLAIIETIIVLLYVLMIYGFFKSKGRADWKIPVVTANIIPFLYLAASHIILRELKGSQYYMELGLSLVMVAFTQFFNDKKLFRRIVVFVLSGWFVITITAGIIFVHLDGGRNLTVTRERLDFIYSALFLTAMISLSALLSMLNFSHWENQRRIERKKNAVQDLLTKKSKHGLFITDGAITSVLGNPSFYQILEREYNPAPQKIQEVMNDVIYPIDMPFAAQIVEKIRNKNIGALPFDLRIILNEDYKWIRVDGLFTEDEGQGPLFLGSLTDIDYLKKSEEKARADSSSIKALLMVGQIYPWELDLENDRFYTLDSSGKGISPFDENRQLSFAKHIESVQKDFRPAVKEAYESLRSGSSSTLDVDYLFNSDGTGRYVWLKDVGFPSRRDRKGNPVIISGYTMDIDSDRRRALRIDQAFRASGFIPWRWDRRKGYAELDEDYIELLGVPLEGLPISRKDFFMHLVHSEDKQRVWDFFSRHASENRNAGRIGEPLQFRIRFHGMDDSIWIEGRIVGAQYDRSGSLLFIEGIFRNITREKRRELRLAEEKREREVANTKNRIFSTVSHELLTPMNGLIGTLAKYEETDMDRIQEELLEKAGLSADLLLSRIHELLDISDLGQGEISLTKDLFSPEELLSGIARNLRDTAFACDIELILDIQSSLPPLLKGDRKRIEQIVKNLVRNGIKFTPKGRVVLSAESKETAPGKNLLKVTVIDNGIGIPSEKIASIFEPFGQVDNSTARSQQGIGLSLAINKQLVELMGGNLDVRSIPGKGSEFTVELPLETGSSRDRGTAQRNCIYPGSKVLVVDDNPINREIAADLLAMREIKVITAMGGSEGLDLIARESPDMVFMDIQMPDMDGYEATRLQRRKEGTGIRTPIIALTANVTDKDRTRAYESGMDGFLPKPIERRKVDILLNKWLKDFRLALEDDVKSSRTDENPFIPGIAMEETLERFSGEYGILVDLLRDYREDYADFGIRISELMERGDREGTYARVHALKGVSGSLGITEVYEISCRIADDYRETADFNRKDLTALEESMSRFLGELNGFLDGTAP